MGVAARTVLRLDDGWIFGTCPGKGFCDFDADDEIRLEGMDWTERFRLSDRPVL